MHPAGPGSVPTRGASGAFRGPIGRRARFVVRIERVRNGCRPERRMDGRLPTAGRSRFEMAWGGWQAGIGVFMLSLVLPFAGFSDDDEAEGYFATALGTSWPDRSRSTSGKWPAGRARVASTRLSNWPRAECKSPTDWASRTLHHLRIARQPLLGRPRRPCSSGTAHGPSSPVREPRERCRASRGPSKPPFGPSAGLSAGPPSIRGTSRPPSLQHPAAKSM
jgi:hypothetical protein